MEPKKNIRLSWMDKEVTIEVKYSIVKSEALQTNMVTQNPGAEKHGTHARHNIGVSVIREVQGDCARRRLP